MPYLDIQRRLKLPLQFILIVPFIIQMFATVGLVGYLCWSNGQNALNEVANQLMNQVNLLVIQHLDTYLKTPHQINQINVNAVKMGMLNLSDLQTTGDYFAKQMQVFDVGYIRFGNPQGEFIGVESLDNGQVLINQVSQNNGIGKLYIYTTDNQLNRQNLIAVKSYDPRLATWYTKAVKVNKPTWSQIDQWQDQQETISISSSYPLNEQQHKFTGVMSVDFTLPQISNFLAGLKIPKNHQVFILEPSGSIVASSLKKSPLKIVNDQTQKLSFLNSQNKLIENISKYLQVRFGQFKNIQDTQQIFIKIQEKKYLVQVTPWHNQLGLDWFVVVVMPESELMAAIETNTRVTILLCLGALILDTTIGVYMARWIANPILKLTHASSAIAYSRSQAIPSSNLEQIVDISIVNELSILSESFNQIACQLSQVLTILETTNQELEQRVAQRTAELTVAKELADASNHAKSEFLAKISHELRTPLNGILGYAQILQFDPETTAEQMEGVNIIYNCGSHLLNLINDILDIAKIESNKLELYIEAFDIQKLLLVVADICRVKAEEKHIGFICQVDSNLPSTVYADKKRLQQVLINLVGNAIKFTQDGIVTLTVEVVNYSRNSKDLQVTTIRFQIVDTGIGMTNAEIATIFLPFEQVGSNSQKSAGTGLGLAISHQIVQMMGSEIQVKSIYGQGSKFWFDLDLPTANIGIISDLSLQQASMMAYPTPDKYQQEIVFPPSGELINLYQAAKAGYTVGIQEEISRIQNLEEKYQEFCRRVWQLMENFDDEVIVEMILPYLDCQIFSRK